MYSIPDYCPKRRSILVRHSVKKVLPRSNSLDSFSFAIVIPFRKRSNNRDCAREMGVLDDCERWHVANDSVTTQLGYSLLIISTESVNYNYRELSDM